jgi:hypothetical protein
VHTSMHTHSHVRARASTHKRTRTCVPTHHTACSEHAACSIHRASAGGRRTCMRRPAAAVHSLTHHAYTLTCMRACEHTHTLAPGGSLQAYSVCSQHAAYTRSKVKVRRRRTRDRSESYSARGLGAAKQKHRGCGQAHAGGMWCNITGHVCNAPAVKLSHWNGPVFVSDLQQHTASRTYSECATLMCSVRR